MIQINCKLSNKHFCANVYYYKVLVMRIPATKGGKEDCKRIVIDAICAEFCLVGVYSLYLKGVGINLSVKKSLRRDLSKSPFVDFSPMKQIFE